MNFTLNINKLLVAMTCGRREINGRKELSLSLVSGGVRVFVEYGVDVINALFQNKYGSANLKFHNVEA